ncbi:methionine adenosyltransferase [Lachnospiraceae bacterium]|jgi:S-adenosylmethionine synthetase|nr:methionine adenosyltransferase [Lachnospiraceae bacterium]
MKCNSSAYTVESVLKGHPDKICDQISDGLLDQYLEKDSYAHTAIECLGTSNTLIVAGEVNSVITVPVEEYCKKLYQKITGISSISVVNLLSQQSSQLRMAVENGGASDQGIMYGYACDNKYNYLPYGYWLVNKIAKRLDSYREKSEKFLSDGKVQVIISENVISKLTINVQHLPDIDMEQLRMDIQENVLYDIDKTNVYINEDGEFVCGGFTNDTGLTGRKIIIDTYGGLAPHGGGAFSGKDPTKVDRSAAYMCRFVAKNIVANGFAKECCISVAYEFGKEQPTMLYVITDGIYSSQIKNIVETNFDFRPQAIIERLNLRKTKFMPTSTYGHFTNPDYPWENIIQL